MTNDALPTDVQRKALCELMHHAFVQLRYLDGEEAHDLAYAFHNLPVEIYGWGTWSVEVTRGRLRYYHSKHVKTNGPNYVELFNKIYPEL